MKIVYLKLILSAIFWGSSAIVGKLLLDAFSVSQVTFLRFFVAAIILLLYTFSTKKNIKLSASDHCKLAILGIVGVSFCYYFYFKGLYYSSALNAGIIEATIPLVTLALSTLLKYEKLNLASSVGFILAYVGVVVIVTKMDLYVVTEFSYNIGDLFLLFGTLCFGFYNILLKKFKFSFDSQQVKLLYIFIYGSIVLIPWLYFDSLANNLNWHFSILNVGLIVIISLGASVLAYMFFNEGIKIIGASKASSFINLVPIITVVFAITILGEKPSISQIIGSVIILTGVYISQNPTFLLTNQPLSEKSHTSPVE